MDKNIFNVDKADYSKPNIFLGEDGNGLFDTVNKQYPELWKLYKTMKSLDWDENEFDYSSCNVQFKSCPKPIYNMMIKTLAWQWEADSVASRCIAPIVANFLTSSEAWAGWQRISDNETVHAATYSEIVRMSFDDPKDVTSEILKVKESLSRLETVSSVFKESYETSHKYALGLVGNNQETYNSAFMFTVALLVLERLQFMSSFAVTFAICDTGMFQPIGKAVQKICQDEFEVHSVWDKAVLNYELKTVRGKIAYEQCKDKILQLVNEVVNSELEWITYLFSGGDELVGVSEELLKDWMLFCARDVYQFLKLDSPYKLPKTNPLKFMNHWLDISKTQPSPQEEDIGQYKLGTVRRDDEGVSFEVDF